MAGGVTGSGQGMPQTSFWQQVGLSVAKMAFSVSSDKQASCALTAKETLRMTALKSNEEDGSRNIMVGLELNKQKV